jgi:lipopolysaccharide biosynthesis glycosyltransferase
MMASTRQATRRRVAVALDDNMIYAFCVLVSSLTARAQAPFSLIVGYFSGKLSDQNLSVVTAMLRYLGVEHEIRELTTNPLFTERRHLTITTFSKFVISDEVSEAHLWLDLDIVARDGWDDFFLTLLADTTTTPLVVADKLKSPFTRFDGFNAGVLGWTNQPREPWAAELANLPEKRFSSEQHLFNTLYSGKFTAVDSRFNFLSSWHHQGDQRERSSLVHYSGPIKPWHLARRHATRWNAINSSWKFWFAAEAEMFSVDLPDALHKTLRRLRHRALFSGRLHTGKGSLAALVFRLLAVTGPFGTPVVWWLARKGAE